MAKSPTKCTLWANVLTLMNLTYGEENLTKLSRETKIGPGTTTRIKDQETSIGIDTLEKLSAKFKVAPWQLLAPELGANLVSVAADGRRLIPAFIPPEPYVKQIANPRGRGNAPRGKSRQIGRETFDEIVPPPRKNPTKRKAGGR